LITELQKRTAHAIVNIFETGKPHGEYGQVTLLPGDTGHLTYGRSQTTLASGNLHLLIKAYVEVPSAGLGGTFHPFLERLAQRDLTLDHDARFRAMLRDAGEDPVMREVQDAFFDRVYWGPSQSAGQSIGMNTALGISVVYDSWIHGSWRLVRDRVFGLIGTPRDAGEKPWVQRYVEERRNWLVTHANTLLHRTVYRMDAFGQLIADKNWTLKLPLRLRGVELTEDLLMMPAPLRISAERSDDRTLRFTQPLMVGRDVEALQRALTEAGIPTEVDGIFGRMTEASIRLYQESNGLRVDGIAGPAVRAALGL
jgi:chitosanase